jgi:arsenite methyltransferase
MAEYLDHTYDWTNEEFVNVFDEVPLWSAAFGLKLFEFVPLRPHLHVLDLGCGAGFPVLDLAQRLGPTCRAYGLDGWHVAMQRARQKIEKWYVGNVGMVGGDAEAIPFAGGTFDLVVSNLGINNFAAPERVLAECARVARSGAHFVITTNLRGHMQPFYDAYAKTLHDLERDDLQAHIDHRMTLEQIAALLDGAGFSVERVEQDTLPLRYLDGTAFLNHHFIQMAFMEAWYEFLPSDAVRDIFLRLEYNLNQQAIRSGELRLDVPMVYIAAEKDS